MLRALVLLFPSFFPSSDLQACAYRWQHRMQLNDWRITVQVVPRASLREGTLGSVRPDFSTRTAVILVMRAEDSDLGRELAVADQRLTVAHEMVHLYRFAIQRDPHWFEEPSTNELTATLVRIRRMKPEMSVLED